MNTHYTQNASVPNHRYGLVSRAILTGMDISQANSFERCVIFGVTSVPSRALMFSIMCESGAQWARIPLHMLRHEEPRKTDALVHSLCELQMWDNHGWEFSITCYEYLRDMSCSFMKRDGSSVPASYWFTLDHTENGWSLYPPEHKCYHLLFLEDGSGQIAAQPNNRIRWKDDSFTNHKLPLNYRVMGEQTWHAEVSRVNAQDTAFTQEDLSKHINNIVVAL